MPPVTPVKNEPETILRALLRPWFLPLVLLASVAAAYWNSLAVPLFFDDIGAITHNATIRHLWPLSGPLTPPGDGSTTTGRPVLNLTYALNYAVGGETVTGYHVGNILIHAAAALALFGLVRRTLESPTLRPRFQTVARPVAFWAALLWALHPLLTESVTCIAQRTESLCGLFYLTTLYGFVRGAGSPTAGRWCALAVLASWLGMGTKEVMVTAPLVVLLFDRTFLAGSFAAAWRLRKGSYLALASSWLLLGGILLTGGGTRGASAGLGLGITWWSYLLKQCEALLLYLKLSVWPHPLVVDYGTAVVQAPVDVWWQGPVVLALLGGTIWSLWRRPVLGFVGAGFFVILAPSSSIVPLVSQTMTEHRMYLPLAALVAAAIVGLYRWLGARAWLLFGAVAVVFAALTVARNHDYRSEVAIWTDNIAKYPQNPRAHANLGVVLQQQGQPAEAVPHFARAIQMRPDYALAHYGLGACYLQLGRPDEALVHLRLAVQIAPKYAEAQLTLGNALVKTERAAEALAHYEQALAVEPAADTHYNLGVALVALGRTDEAIAHFESALALAPSLAEPHFQLAKILARANRIAEAEMHYEETLRLAPAHAAAHRGYGLLLARANRLPSAAEHLSRAVALEPDNAEAHGNLGNVLLLQGRTSDAIREYQAALRLNPTDERIRANLNAALQNGG